MNVTGLLCRISALFGNEADPRYIFNFLQPLENA